MKSVKRPYVWIVEGSFDGGSWHPTVGVALERARARPVLAQWKARNPYDRFRLRRYVAQKTGQ